eukprot:765470-Hanusia_phi.AAC.6
MSGAAFLARTGIEMLSPSQRTRISSLKSPSSAQERWEAEDLKVKAEGQGQRQGQRQRQGRSGREVARKDDDDDDHDDDGND